MTAAMTWCAAIYLSIFARTLVHELGHACVALRMTTYPVVVLIGKPLVLPRFGRLTLGLGLGGTGGVCVYGPPCTRRAEAALAGAGPTASLLLGIVAAAGFFLVADASLREFPGILCAVLAAAATTDAIVNGWPRSIDVTRSLFGVGENDGTAVARLMGWRDDDPVDTKLCAPAAPAPAAVPVRPPLPMIRPWAAVALVLCLLLAVLVAPLMALVIVALFALAALQDGEDKHAERMAEAHAPAQPQSRPPPGP